MPGVIKEIIAQHKNALKVLEKETFRLKKIALLCRKSLEEGNKILFFGNGGSAADSQHLAAEFVGRFQKNRKPFSALALSVDTSILTAVGNDFGFETVFQRQIAALGRPGDIAFGLSTSGKSPNIIKAFQEAKNLKLTTIAFLGQDGGEAFHLADVSLKITTSQTPRIQEIHILAGHIVCQLIEDSLSG